MCGIAGIISFAPGKINQDRLKAMNNSIAHRGPDGENYYIYHTDSVQVGFAHRRLSIIDLSDAGIQPMRFLNRYMIIHNGELYNYIELRETLIKQGLKFRTNTDTEVIAAAFHIYGSDCLNYFDGMFSFSIWDEQENRLFSARDRFGEKPFYYHYDEVKKEFLFASEMKALWAAGVKKEPDGELLFQYITTGQERLTHHPERSGYAEIYQLPHSHFLEMQVTDTLPRIQTYWDLDKETKAGITDDEAILQFSSLFQQSVSRRLRSDVPVGTSLSGGLDSSSIVAQCDSVSGTGYSHNSFSAVFPGFEKDETHYINEVVNHFSLKHFSVSPGPADLADLIVKVFFHQEIPFSSSSVYAQFKVFELANSKKIKVLLDGQGADEVLGGYSKYTHWFLQEQLSSNSISRVNSLASLLKENHFLENWGYKNIISAKLPGLAANTLERRVAKKQFNHPMLHRRFVEEYYDRKNIYKPVVDKLNDILYFDTLQGGLQELLHYADRNSMAHGCEVRLPFLNHELVSFIFSLPADLKFRDGFSKWILRASCEKTLPEKIVWRKGKTGFETPQKEWMEYVAVQQKIAVSKQILVEKNILKADVLKKKITSTTAYEENGYDWRYWMAGLMFE